MLGNLGDYDLRDIVDKAGLAAKGRAFAESLGCRHFAYILLRPPNGKAIKDDFVVSNYPTEWVNRYLDRNYRVYDPVTLMFDHAHLPFRWGHKDFLRPLKKASLAVLHEARAFGLSEGYSVPKAGPEGDTGGFTLCANNRDGAGDLALSAGPQIQLFAAHFHAAAVQVMCGDYTVSDLNLSERELDVLSRAADGFSSEATAVKLGLTAATVNYHIANCCKKLGACNKIHAVAIAMRSRLI